MSFTHRWIAVGSLFAVAPASTALAQEPAPRPRPEALRMERQPFGRFSYRVPRITMRMSPRMGFARGELLLRARERSLERMDRLQDRRFALESDLRERRNVLRERVRQRQFEARGRAMTRVRELRDRVRPFRMDRVRPFMVRRYLRTI